MRVARRQRHLVGYCALGQRRDNRARLRRRGHGRRLLVMAVERGARGGGTGDAGAGGEEGGGPAEVARAAERAVAGAWVKLTHRIPLACRTVKLGTLGKGKAK
jgi:hypothetical protein